VFAAAAGRPAGIREPVGIVESEYPTGTTEGTRSAYRPAAGAPDPYWAAAGPAVATAINIPGRNRVILMRPPPDRPRLLECGGLSPPAPVYVRGI